MQNRGISQAVIRRLPRYYRYLGELIEQGVERISSNELSKRMKVRIIILLLLVLVIWGVHLRTMRHLKSVDLS